jgi:hypothetical protein
MILFNPSLENEKNIFDFLEKNCGAFMVEIQKSF